MESSLSEGGFLLTVNLAEFVNLSSSNSLKWSLNTVDKWRLFLWFSDGEPIFDLVTAWLKSVGSETRVICNIIKEKKF